eukprot:506298-Prorocentrum_minimum.AAC.4
MVVLIDVSKLDVNGVQVMNQQNLNPEGLLARFFSMQMLSAYAKELGKSPKGNTAVLAARISSHWQSQVGCSTSTPASRTTLELCRVGLLVYYNIDSPPLQYESYLNALGCALQASGKGGVATSAPVVETEADLDGKEAKPDVETQTAAKGKGAKVPPKLANASAAAAAATAAPGTDSSESKPGKKARS